jgi:3-phenylpropionate/cinnamic acid dioxygenase small subunit
MKLDTVSSLELTKQLIDEVKKVNGTFITLWHNETMSDAKRWEGWLEVYRSIILYALPEQLAAE